MGADILHIDILILLLYILLRKLLQPQSRMIGANEQFTHLNLFMIIYIRLGILNNTRQHSHCQNRQLIWLAGYLRQNNNNICIIRQMPYCQSQAFSPVSFVLESENQVTMLSLAYATQFIFVALGLYIIFKMCKLCSQAFSYSNFHIHENYKFYTLALISTIMILVSRSVQLEFADKISQAKLHPDDFFPFRKDPYYQGWIIFNEITGIISEYTVNLMYALTGVTWLMIAYNCDFNSRDGQEKLDEEEEQKKISDNKFYVRLRVSLLYGYIPVAMILSVCGQMHYSRQWCLTSKILTAVTNFLVYLLFFYSLVNIFHQKRQDSKTPLKIKLIWGYLIIASTLRQCTSAILSIQDLFYPSECDYAEIKGQSKVLSNIFVFLYSIVVTTIPIFFLSYLANKQLQTEKSQIEQTERIIYSSTII